MRRNQFTLGSLFFVVVAAANPGKSSSASSGNRHSQWFLLGFYLLAIASGIREIRYRQESALDLLVPFSMALWLSLWALADSKQRGRPILWSLRCWFFLLAVIVVPCYVIWTRGWRGLGLVAANTIAWTILSVVTTVIGGRLVFGADWAPN
ncbi:MAG TPA: hypothetical protein VMV10_15165 [Pirellulales bacterium]|nr:hypothetical protein [Pirellulales bacterium]